MNAVGIGHQLGHGAGEKAASRAEAIESVCQLPSPPVSATTAVIDRAVEISNDLQSSHSSDAAGTGAARRLAVMRMISEAATSASTHAQATASADPHVWKSEFSD